MKSKRKGNPAEWIFLIAVLVFAYITFMYKDITNTADNSIIFIRSIAHGQFTKFYEMSVLQAQTDFAANYNIIIYVFFSIWILPAYAIAKLLHIEFMSWPLGLLWVKTFIVLLTCAITYLIHKIVQEHAENKDYGPLAAFVYLSSMSVIYPVFITAQIDSIEIFFMLLGLLGYLRDNKILFYLSFLIAVPCKMFALLVALPLILLKEKNLWKAGLSWILLASPIAIENLIFRNSAVHKYALAAQSNDAIRQILNSNLKTGRTLILFLVCYICIVVFCYMTTRRDTNLAIYVCAFVWATFSVFIRMNTYWILLMIPFLTINIFVNARYLGITMFLETISSFFYVMTVGASGTWILQDHEILRRLLLPYFVSLPEGESLKYSNLYNLFVAHNIDRYIPLFSTLFCIPLLAILFLSFPRHKKFVGITDYILTEDNYPPHWLLCLRLVPVFFIVGLMIYAGTARTNPVYYSNKEAESRILYVNLTSRTENNVITQSITFDEERDLEELKIPFHNLYNARDNMSLLSIEFWNVTENTCEMKKCIGGNTVMDGEDIKVSLKKIHVTSGSTYEIRLSGTGGIAHNINVEYISPHVTTQADPKLPDIQVNGTSRPGNLLFEIK